MSTAKSIANAGFRLEKAMRIYENEVIAFFTPGTEVEWYHGDSLRSGTVARTHGFQGYVDVWVQSNAKGRKITRVNAHRILELIT